MVLAAWVALLGGGVLAGLGPVGAMAWPRRFELLAGAVTLLAAALSATGLVGIAILAQRTDEAVVAGLLGVASALGGFALGGALLSEIGGEPAPASLPSALPPDTGRTSVVVLAEAEPEEYRPAYVAAELRELSEAGVQLPPETMRAFIFASEKSRYRSIGSSSARPTTRLVAARLAHLLEGDGFDGVEIAWSDAEPRLDEAVASLAARGSRRIVVAVLSVSEGATIANDKRRVDALRPEAAGVRLAYAEPLWSSTSLSGRVAERIVAALGETPPAAAGVALLGTGQPPEVEENDPTRTTQETYFNQRIRALLLERGFDEARVRLAWMEWQEPDVTEVVRHLAALGCEKILVVPAAMPTESRSTLIDVPDAVGQARVERTATVKVLPAWGDEDAVAEAVAQKVREAAAEL